MRAEIHEVLSELEAEGTLAPAQRQRVAERLAARLDAPRDRTGRLISILAACGGVLMGAGVLYLIGYNWESFGRGLKLALIFGLWILVHAAGWWLAEGGGRAPHVGRALTLLGILCFGAALFLVAQIYHLSAHFPWSVCLWWALSVPLLFLTRSRAIQVVLTGLFLLWAFWHAAVWYEDQDAIIQSWKVESAGQFLLGGALALLFGALAAWAEVSRHARFAAPWRSLCLTGVLLSGYLCSFEGLADSSAARAHPWIVLAPCLLATACALPVLGVALVRGSHGALRDECLGALALLLLFALLCWGAPELLPLAGNLLLLAAIALLVWHGTRIRSAGHVNLALVCFGLLVVTRYCEYLWDKLSGAYAFLGAGALLFGLGWFLERRRRALMARVRGGAA